MECLSSPSAPSPWSPHSGPSSGPHAPGTSCNSAGYLSGSCFCVSTCSFLPPKCQCAQVWVKPLTCLPSVSPRELIRVPLSHLQTWLPFVPPLPGPSSRMELPCLLGSEEHQLQNILPAEVKLIFLTPRRNR